MAYVEKRKKKELGRTETDGKKCVGKTKLGGNGVKRMRRKMRDMR